MLSRLFAPVLGALVLFGALLNSGPVFSDDRVAGEPNVSSPVPLPEVPSALGLAASREVYRPAPPATVEPVADSSLPLYVVGDIGPNSNQLVRYEEEAGQLSDGDVSACGDSCCGTSGCGNMCCDKAGRFWVRGEYLLWWTKGAGSPPLLTTSPAGTPKTEAGILGFPDTEILFPGAPLNNDSRSGYRFSFGLWLDECRKLAFEGDFWDLGAGTTSFHASGDGSPILARPYYDTFIDGPNAALISFDGGGLNVTGEITINASDYFQSAGGWLTYNLMNCREKCSSKSLFRLDMLAGYRHYRYNDNLSIHTLTVNTPPGTVTLEETDSFHTHNDFHGGELGVRTEMTRGRWSLSLLAKAAFGNTHQVVTISGQTIRTIGTNPPIVTDGALFTADNNLGQFSRDRFAVIPQFGAEIGFDLTCNCRVFGGYNFLYWANVQRAGSQIDFNVDPINNTSPVPQLTNTDFWAQGVNAGLECRF